jgi:hypothetical protein
MLILKLLWDPEVFCLQDYDGPIAQSVEQGTHNPLVPGSSPGGPILNMRDSWLSWLERRPHMAKVEGSNPSESTRYI